MNHTDDGYAALLLTMALSPDREEYAYPYTIREFRSLENAVRETHIRRIGGLLNVDISGLMLYLDMTEAEAYRAYTLLHRTVQLSYAMERFMRQGIDIVTCYDEDYPLRLNQKLRGAAPAFFYRCGDAGLMKSPFIAILGISGIRTGAALRETIGILVKNAVEKGYGIITGGELGISTMASELAAQYGGVCMDVLGGGMRDHINADGIAEQIALQRAMVISTQHPDAMFTASHGAARNRLVFSLADAAFVFNTDGRRGEAEALQNRYCDWIYAWEGCPENRALISKGAIPLGRLDGLDFEDMSRHWNSSAAEQLNMFDMFKE